MSHNKKEYAKFFRRPIFSSLAKGKDISVYLGVLILTAMKHCFQTMIIMNMRFH